MRLGEPGDVKPLDNAIAEMQVRPGLIATKFLPLEVLRWIFKVRFAYFRF
jgi:hypothetical protein